MPYRPPERWLEFRDWLCGLTDRDRTFVRAWIAKWMQPDGALPHHRDFTGKISAPNAFDGLPKPPPETRKGIRFKRPGEKW